MTPPLTPAERGRMGRWLRHAARVLDDWRKRTGRGPVREPVRCVILAAQRGWRARVKYRVDLRRGFRWHHARGLPEPVPPRAERLRLLAAWHEERGR